MSKRVLRIANADRRRFLDRHQRQSQLHNARLLLLLGGTSTARNPRSFAGVALDEAAPSTSLHQAARGLQPGGKKACS